MSTRFLTLVAVVWCGHLAVQYIGTQNIGVQCLTLPYIKPYYHQEPPPPPPPQDSGRRSPCDGYQGEDGYEDEDCGDFVPALTRDEVKNVTIPWIVRQALANVKMARYPLDLRGAWQRFMRKLTWIVQHA